jgi:hypothetical protein
MAFGVGGDSVSAGTSTPRGGWLAIVMMRSSSCSPVDQCFRVLGIGPDALNGRVFRIGGDQRGSYSFPITDVVVQTRDRTKPETLDPTILVFSQVRASIHNLTFIL